MVQNPPLNEDNFLPVQGNDRVVIFRPLSKAGTEDAKGLAYETNHTLNVSRDMEEIVTKNATIYGHNRPSRDGEVTTYYERGSKQLEEIEDSVYSDDPYEFWFIDRALQNEDGKFRAEYARGYFTSFNITASAGSSVEVSLPYQLETLNKPIRGWATVTEAQAEAIIYAYRDTIAGSEPEPDSE